MDAFAVAVSVAFGLAVGSFLNVVIHRMPRGESIMRPRSRCPKCGTDISPRDNIPVLSWLLLRGRCRHCGETISSRYPIIEALTAALFAVIALRFGWNPPLPAFLVFAAVLVALSAIDLEHRRLPTPIVWTGFVLGLALLVLATLISPRHEWWLLLRGLIAAAACGAVFLALVLAVPRGMGMGDARLVTLEGLFLGWLGAGIPVVGLFLGFLVGALVGIGLMATRRAGRRSMIPFGPFLATGAFLAILWGQQIIDRYRGV